MRPESATRFALLGLLLDQPHHGYDLYQRFIDPAGLGQVWHLGMSQVYADLKTLEARGWVDVTVEHQDPRPARKVFALTKAGHSVFRKWLATPSRGLREMRVEFIVRLFFARRAGAREVAALVARQEKSLHDELDRIQHDMALSNESADFVQAIHSFRLSQIEAAITWLKSIREPAGGPVGVKTHVRGVRHEYPIGRGRK